jgi:hypothetical protein
MTDGAFADSFESALEFETSTNGANGSGMMGLSLPFWPDRSRLVGKLQVVLAECGGAFTVAGHADALRADARKGCGFCERIAVCERTNPASG